MHNIDINVTNFTVDGQITGKATLLAANWQEDTLEYPKYYDLEVAGTLLTDRGGIIFPIEFLDLSSKYKICTTTTIPEENKVRIRAKETPLEDIDIQYWIFHQHNTDTSTESEGD